MARRSLLKSVPRLSKRAKFVASTALLTLGLLIAFLLGPEFEQQTIAILALLAFCATLYCLWQELTGRKWMIVVILPVLFTISCGLFYFLLPSRWLVRILMLLVFSIGFYAMLLAQNIFLVSSLRSIKLLHAARTIAFLLSVVCAFALYDVLFSLHALLPVVVLGILVASFLLILPIVWNVSLTEALGSEELLHTMILTMVLAEVGTFLTFWSITSTFAAIFLAGNYYTLVGVSTHWLEHRLFKRVLWEFIWVAGILVAILFFTAKWGG